MMATKTSNTAGVCWLEHQTLEHIKGALRVALNWSDDEIGVDQKRSSLAFTLQSFRRHFERLMAIEEQDGYLREVSEGNPQAHEQIERLQAEHDRFRMQLRSLDARLQSDFRTWGEAELDSTCEEITLLLREIDSHDLEEIDLLQDTLQHDEGGEG